MSKGAVNQVIQRAIGDAAFRRQLQSDPKKALAGFDLTRDERSAITSGDPSKLTALGVDQRMSKAYGLGAISAASKSAVSPDLTGAGTSAFIDEGGVAGRATSAIEQGGASANTANLRRIEGDLNTGAAVTAPGAGIRDAHDSEAYSAGAKGDPGSQYPSHFGLAGPSTVGGSIRDTHDSAAYSAAKVDTTNANTTNLRRIEGDLNTGAAVNAPGSAIRDAHDVFKGAAGSAIRDTHDSAAYSAAKVDTTNANTTNLRRIEGDLNTASATTEGTSALNTGASAFEGGSASTAAARTPVDVSGDFNRFDPGLTSGSGSAVTPGVETVNIPGVGVVPANEANAYVAGGGSAASNATALEPTDTSGDLNAALDPGYVSDDSAARETDVANDAGSHGLRPNEPTE